MRRLFQAVRESVTALQAAEQYGLEVKPNGMTCCPFHQDNEPSLKLDKRFHCFGCGVDGDVIDFTSLLFSLSPFEAARKLAKDFPIVYDEGKPPQQCRKEKQKKTGTDEYEITQALDRAYADILREYFQMLKIWKADFAPANENDEWDSLFCEAVQNLERVDHLIAELWYAEGAEKIRFITQYGEEIEGYGNRVREYHTGSAGTDSEDTRSRQSGR